MDPLLPRPPCAELKPLLAVSPGMASRPEMRGVARVGELIGALERWGVDSAATLGKAWASDPSFLQREVCMWVNPGNHGKVAKMWAGLVRGALEVVERAESVSDDMS